MTKTTKELLVLHGLTEEDIYNFSQSENVIYFKEYEEGFLSLVRDKDYDHLYSAAINNHYGFKMWKDLINLVDNRERPIMVVFGANHDRLFRAASRYDYEKINENTIIIR